MILGIVAAGYAVWPLLRGRRLPPLGEPPDHERAEAEAEAEVAVLLAWSAAAGEMRREAEPAGQVDRLAR
jgi:hypothetical protein